MNKNPIISSGGENEKREQNSPIKNTRVGLYNENFTTANVTISETKLCTIRRHQATFTITAGPLLWGGKELKETFVLEIHYRDSENAHAATLPLHGFSSQLCYDYAEKAHELALQFIEEQGWMLNTHLNSWPEFQAVVSMAPNKKVVADAKQHINNALCNN